MRVFPHSQAPAAPAAAQAGLGAQGHPGADPHRWYPPGTHITVRGLVKRFAEAWARGVKEAQRDSSTRGYLIAGMKVPPELAAVVPLPRIVMAKDLSAADATDFQKFLDLGVELGVVKDKLDGRALVRAF